MISEENGELWVGMLMAVALFSFAAVIASCVFVTAADNASHHRTLNSVADNAALLIEQQPEATADDVLTMVLRMAAGRPALPEQAPGGKR